MRIILADHHPQALWALETMLQEKPEFEVTGEAGNAKDLLAMITANPPHLALIDCDLPGSSIEDLIAEVHSLDPKLTVVVMSSRPEYSQRLLRVGADAFVSKSDQPEWLLETLQKYEKQFKMKKGE